jgi:predicted Zn-dependent protease
MTCRTRTASATGRGIALALSVLLAGVAGCRGARPIGAGAEYEPNEREQRLWEASRAFERQLLERAPLYHDERTRSYVAGVLERVVGPRPGDFAPLTPRVYLIDVDVPNAFCLPHGAIFVHTGLLGRISSEAQLAMLLGHELTHATHRHTWQEYQHAFAATAAHSYLSVLASVAGGYYADAVSGLSAVITQSAISGYSRDKEDQADEQGLTLAARAGYDPREAARLFQRMLDATDKADRRYSFLYSTHPKLKQRVESCAKRSRKLPPAALERAPEVGAERYAAVAGPLMLRDARRQVAAGRFALALETAERLALQPLLAAEAHVLRGDALRARHAPGDDDSALAAYREAVGCDERSAPAHRALGLLLISRGDAVAARPHLERYLSLARGAPDTEYIRSLLSDAPSARGAAHE